MSGHERAYRQASVIVVALVLWAAWGRESLATFVVCYLASLALINAAIVAKTDLLPKLSRGQALFLLGLPALVPVAIVYREAGDIYVSEGFKGSERWLADRVRLERTPAVHPPVIADDHPQRFYVHAPSAARVSVALPGAAEPIESVALGHGVFRVWYDPEEHGPPAKRSGPFEVRLIVDGGSTARTLDAVLQHVKPRWFASAPDLGIAATVSHETDELLLVRRSGKVARIDVGDGPVACAFVDGGRVVAVTHRFSPELFFVDVASAEVEKKLPVGRFQGGVTVSGDERLLAVAMGGTNRGVQLVALPSLDRAGSVRLGFVPDFVEFGPTRGEMLVAWRQRKTLYRLGKSVGGAPDPVGLPLPGRKGDPTAGWRMHPDALPLGRPAVAMGTSKSRSTLYVATTGLDETGGEVLGNHFVQHHLLTIDVRKWKVVDDFVTDRHSHDQDRAASIEHGSGIAAIAPSGEDEVLLAFSGTNEVWRVRPGTRSPERRVDLGEDLAAPHGVADLGDGHWVVSSPSTGSIGVFDAEGKRVAFSELAQPDETLKEVDLAAWLRRQGEKAFFESTRAGIACHSCHVYGDSDYSKHNIGQSTMFPTLSTYGVAGTSPYLRDASYPRVTDMMQVALEVYRGFRRPALVGRGESLEAYVHSLPMLPNPNGFEPADARRERAGLDAFVRAQCDLCHTPPAFTNLGQHLVRSIFPDYGAKLPAKHVVDIPSLIGLATSAPYLHDGRAKTVEEVLVEHNSSNRHGNVEALNDEERAELIYFLEHL